MRRTIRLISTLAVLSCSTTAAIAAEDYVDHENHFRVSIPAGWEHHVNVADKIDLVLLSPRVEKTEGMCILMGELSQEAEKISQQEINEGMGEFDDAFWRSIVEDKDTTDIKVEISTEMRDERKVALATVHYTVTTDGKPVPSVDYYILQIVPGVILMGQCGVPVAHVNEERADMKVVFDTFAPSGGAGIISKMTPPGNETRLLNAGPRSTVALAAQALAAARAERTKHRHR